jgi:transcriptional regulator with XRE-family HTH domain
MHIYFFMPKKVNFKLKDIGINSKTIGQHIAEARKKKGLTQTQLAEKIGITQYLVSNFEIGRINITAEMLCHFALALGVSIDKLVGFKNDDNSKIETPLRFTRRIQEISKLPEIKKKAILKTLDDLIKANS